MTGLRTQVSEWLESLAAALLLLPAAIIAIAVALFSTGHSLSGAVLPGAIVLSLLALRLFAPSWRHAFMVAILAAVIHIAAGFIAVETPDQSFDGLAYHQEAILRLASGWNPLFEDSAKYGIGNDIFINHYPKASWISGAAILLSTGHVEAGKLLNLTWMVAAGLIVTVALLRLTNLHAVLAVGLGILAALNPVAVSQSVSFYVDGALASLLTVVIGGLTIWAIGHRRRSLAVALLAFVLAANLKFTGVIYGTVLLSSTVAAVWYWRGARAAVRMAAAASVAGAVAILLFGYSPYVRNFREYGDPFYPVHGAPQLIGLGADGSRRPANLNDSNRVMRFIISNFSFSHEGTRGTMLKFPFRVSRGELFGRIYGADLEVGGFGPLYGGMLLMACLLGAIVAVRADVPRTNLGIFLIGLAVLASIFIHAETWWARYVPQAWLLPLLVIVPGMCAPRRSFRWWMGRALVGIACINVSIVAINVFSGTLEYARATRSSLSAMAAASQPVRVNLGGFSPLRRRLQEAGIEFVEVPKEAQIGHIRNRLPASGGDRAFWIE